MPTVLRVKGYRFFFFSLDWQEPMHIHVEKAEGYAKFWLEPVSLARSHGFRSHEISEMQTIVVKNRKSFEEKWNEYFSNKG